MTTQPTTSRVEDAPIPGVEQTEIRAALERIVAHPDFEASQRLRDFLTFVVEESLAGRADGIKEQTVARHVFERGEDFDGGRDAVVRVEAGRLRRRLQHYYFSDGQRDPIRIDIPKGGYVPRFSRQPAAPAAGAPSAPSRHAADARRETSTDPVPTIAIIPFRELGADPGSTFFGAGLVAELVGEVNRYEGVVAVPCQPDEEPLPVGDGSVGARFVLEGSVRKDEVELKIVVHLTDTRTVRQIWGGSYKIPLDAPHLISVQEELARDLIAAVADEHGVISRRLAHESRDKPPTALSSYEALLRYHYYLLVMTPEVGEEAFHALHAATEREPEYGPTWAALANLHVHAFLFDRPGLDDPLTTALEYAKRGAALAPDSQLARSHLAYLYLLTRQLALFHEEAEAALALNPSSPTNAGTLGYLFALAGEYDRAEALLGHAFSSGLRQPSWFHHGLFLVYYTRGDYEQASLEAQRGFPPVGFWDSALRAAALGKLGRVDAAAVALDEVRKLKPDFEERAEELLSRTPVTDSVREDVLDGLRKAGMRSGPSTGPERSSRHSAAAKTTRTVS